MITLSWTLFAVLALLWTGAAWITAAAAGWAAEALAGGSASQTVRDLATLPLPDWLKFWIDPEWLQAVQSALQWAIDGAGAGLPFLASIAGWIVPAIWIGWGLGAVLLLVAALAVHLLVRRFTRPAPAPVAAA